MTFSQAFGRTPVWACRVGSWWTLGDVAHRWDPFLSLDVYLWCHLPLQWSWHRTLTCFPDTFHLQLQTFRNSSSFGNIPHHSQNAPAGFFFPLSCIVWWVRNRDWNLQWIHRLYKLCAEEPPRTLTEEHRNSNLPVHPDTCGAAEADSQPCSLTQCRMFAQASTPFL